MAYLDEASRVVITGDERGAPCCRHCTHPPGYVHEMGCLLGCTEPAPAKEPAP